MGEQQFFSFSNYVKNIALNLRVGNGEKQVGFVCVISENIRKKILCNRLFLSCKISTFMFYNKSRRLKNENKLYQLVASIDIYCVKIVMFLTANKRGEHSLYM